MLGFGVLRSAAVLALTVSTLSLWGCGKSGIESVENTEESDDAETEDAESDDAQTEETEAAEDGTDDETDAADPDGGAPDGGLVPDAGECTEQDCEPEAGADAPGPMGPVARIGIPDEETGLYFVGIEDGADIPIRRGGQGGSHAMIAIECEGFGNRVRWVITLENLDEEGEIATLPLARPQPIICEDDGVCRKSPLTVLLGGLADPDDWEGLHVRASVTVTNDDGLEASHSVTGYLTYD